MLLRLVVFFGLGVVAVAHHRTLIAVFCFTIPLLSNSKFPITGTLSMYLAVIVALLFYVDRMYIAGSMSLALLVFNLVGNWLVNKK